MGEIMTTSKKTKVLLFISMLLTVTVWILNQSEILSYEYSSLAIIVLVMGLIFVYGAKAQAAEIEEELKQQKRDEHERISRLMNDDMENTDYGQEIPASANHSRTKKPF